MEFSVINYDGRKHKDGRKEKKKETNKRTGWWEWINVGFLALSSMISAPHYPVAAWVQQ